LCFDFTRIYLLWVNRFVVMARVRDVVIDRLLASRTGQLLWVLVFHRYYLYVGMAQAIIGALDDVLPRLTRQCGPVRYRGDVAIRSARAPWVSCPSLVAL
jgi:hypothetical protein